MMHDPTMAAVHTWVCIECDLHWPDRSLADDPQAVERAAIRMWASDLGGHGIDAGIAWDDATEGERQWYRNIFLVGLRAAEGGTDT